MVGVALIGVTRVERGLAVRCVLDEAQYEAGWKISDEAFASINLSRADFYGAWNYTISPNSKNL